MLTLDKATREDSRLQWVALGILAGLGLLLAGLWHVQIVTRAKYQASLQNQSFRNVRLPAVRGKILDRNGVVLAENNPSFNVGVYLGDIRPLFVHEYTNRLKPEFRALYPGRKMSWSDRVALEEIARYRVVSNLSAQASGLVLGTTQVLNPASFKRHYLEEKALPLPILTDLGAKEVARFVETAAELPGMDLMIEPVRHYPQGSLAAHVVGYVRKTLQVSDGEDDYIFRYYLPDYQGQSAVESAFDTDLRGKAGAKSMLVNNLGYRQEEETWLTPQPGKDVVLTLDAEIQKAAERALGSSGPATRGSIVVLDVRNGDILAAASSPTYDLNQFVSGSFTPEEWARLNDEELAPQYNRAFRGAYPPGSTFKIVVGLACMEAGIVDENTSVYTPGYYPLGRRKINDEAAPGNYSWKEAFKHSCNYYFIDNGLKLGPERILLMAEQFNLGETTGAVPHRQEASGYLPRPGTKEKRDGARWQDGDTANLTIGQGEILVTPLQMAVMTAAVANGGKVLRPRLVSRLVSQGENGRLEAMPGGVVEKELNVRKKHLDILRAALLAVVEEPGGSGKNAFVPGMRVSGKTGTAQIRKPGGVRDHITWFVSFAPFEESRYAVVVMVESGVSGGNTCAPKAREVYRAIQKIERERAAAENPPRLTMGGN